MFRLQFVCLLCLIIWNTKAGASPVTRHYADENAIYYPRQIIEYQKAHDNLTPHSAILPAEGSGNTASLEKNESKRKSGSLKTTRIRRSPTGFSARGFHEEVFDRDFGHFSPVKRRPESDSNGFYGDTFSNGFGEFETMKRRMPTYGYKAMSKMDMMDPRFGLVSQRLLEAKRSPEMTKSGFHSDVFNGGFGEFHPM